MQVSLRRVILVALTLVPATAHAGIRPSGPYSGVVVFDRWGGCILYSGVYVMYVSERVKERLRPYVGRTIRINATQVRQPKNPGDALIQAFTYTGPETIPPDVASLRLTTRRAAGDDLAGIVLELENVGPRSVHVRSDELAPTLLTTQVPPKTGEFTFSPSDGPSIAVITRESFWVDGPRWDDWAIVNGEKVAWSIGRRAALPYRFRLRPGEVRRLRLTFRLPPGQYEFLCGYGGGVHARGCIASNRTAFNVPKTPAR